MSSQRSTGTQLDDLRTLMHRERERLDRILSASELTDDHLAVLIRHARSIMQRWQPTTDQTAALLRLQLSRIEEERGGLARIAFIHRCLYLVRIDRLLHSLMPGDQAALKGLHTPNDSAESGGRIPLDLLCQEDLLGCTRMLAHLELTSTATERGGPWRGFARIPESR